MLVTHLGRDTRPQAVPPLDGSVIPAYHGMQHRSLLSAPILCGWAGADASGDQFNTSTHPLQPGDSSWFFHQMMSTDTGHHEKVRIHRPVSW